MRTAFVSSFYASWVALCRRSLASFRHSLGLVALGLCALLLAGCAASRGGPVPYDVQNFNAPDAPAAVSEVRDYRLGPTDVISVTVFGVAEFSGDYTIDNLGRIKMPLVGDISVQGKTTDQTSADLTERLKQNYLRDPIVQVVLKTALSQRVTIDGSVTQPGVYPAGSDLSLIQVIALARGMTADANPRRVVVFRQINGQRMAASFDVTDIRRGIQPDPKIYGNDIVVVDGNRASANFKTILQTLPLVALFRPF